MEKFAKELIERFTSQYRKVKTDEDAEWNRAIYKCKEITKQFVEEYKEKTEMNNIEKIIENLKRERNAEIISFPTEESLQEHKDQCDFLITLLENQKNDWIPCSVREPDEEEMKYSYRRNMHACEFIVMISGVTRPTTLYRTWDGLWVDDKRKQYDVVAWRLLPEPYQPEEEQLCQQ